MKSLTLADGRTIKLENLSIEGTYSGHMEGSRESISRHIVERLDAESDSVAMQVIGGAGTLPKYQCTAFFTSNGISDETGDLSSMLTVVWFTDRVPDSIEQLLDPLRTQIDWVRYASEFDPYDF
jgi:hypothetical protein